MRSNNMGNQTTRTQLDLRNVLGINPAIASATVSEKKIELSDAKQTYPDRKMVA
jgi:hypothetical protein